MAEGEPGESKILSFAKGKELQAEQLRLKLAMLDEIEAKLTADILALRAHPSQAEYLVKLNEAAEKLDQVQNWIRAGLGLQVGDPGVDQARLDEFLNLKLK